MPAIFQPRIAVRVIVICSDHKPLWRDSYKGVDRALTPDESIMHKIIIIIIISQSRKRKLFFLNFSKHNHSQDGQTDELLGNYGEEVGDNFHC